MNNPVSLTEHRDKWIAQKQLDANLQRLLAEQKAAWTAYVNGAIGSLAQAGRALAAASTLSDTYAAIDSLCEITRDVSGAAHEMKSFCDWRLPPAPEFQDHLINQHFLLPRWKRTFWLEGAVQCGLGLEMNDRILELCCGTGYYADIFYSPFASEIVAVDFDPRAIEVAQRFHRRQNVRFEVMDIREQLPDGPFNAVIWDGAIEHFTAAEIADIMERLRRIMTPEGRLLGYTVAEPPDAPQLPTHETHFAGIEMLGQMLKAHFENVRVFERVHPVTPPMMRHNLFFQASNGTLPFDPDWKHGLRL